MEKIEWFKRFPELTRECFQHQKVKPESCQRSVLPSLRQRGSKSSVARSWPLGRGTGTSQHQNDLMITCFRPHVSAHWLTALHLQTWLPHSTCQAFPSLRNVTAWWRKVPAKTLSLSTENIFHRKNFVEILVNWIRTLEICRDSVHMHNYQKKRNTKKYKFWDYWYPLYRNLPINTWKIEFWKDTLF